MLAPSLRLFETHATLLPVGKLVDRDKNHSRH